MQAGADNNVKMHSKLRPVMLVALGALTLIITVETLATTTAIYHGGFQIDFKYDLYRAAETILNGRSPYHPALLQQEAAILRAGKTLGLTISPRYPPLSMLATAPLTMLPFPTAAVIFFLLSAVAFVVALWLLEVRDVRAIIVATVSAPAAYGLWIGNPSVWLLLGVACVWHWRSHSIKMAVATAAVIALKLLLWPLGAWMLITKRFRLLIATCALTVFMLLASWAVIGFKGLAAYPQMLVNIAYIGELRGSSLVTVLLHIGISSWPARMIALLCAGALVVAAWYVRTYPAGERRAFGLITVAVLVASPVVWVHYFVLLYVPIALLSPRLSLLWFVPAFASFAPLPNVGVELIVAGVLCAPMLRGLGGVREQVPDVEADAVSTPAAVRRSRLGIASLLLAPIR